ncbi:hypothetical protein EI94DRAFT_1803038 [Lactarius quietus]|nr:hypothetical protein EI94DRAFT_1803038 [Lactarius quietus]
MSSQGPHPGEVVLHSMVSLENRQTAPGKPNTFIYDGLFPCSDTASDAVGSFRYYVGQDHTKKLDDVYKIHAKIVNFQPGRNVNSEEYGDESINVLGEIRTMQPLSTDQAANIDDIIRISATSTITSINNVPPSFSMHVSQFIAGGKTGNDITIHAELERCPKWQNPSKHLPQPKAIVTVCVTCGSRVMASGITKPMKVRFGLPVRAEDPPEVRITEEEDEESLRLDEDETYEVARMLSTDDHFIVDNNTGDVIRLGMMKSESHD